MIINLLLCDKGNNNILHTDVRFNSALDLNRYNVHLKHFVKKARHAVLSGDLEGSIFSISNGSNTLALRIGLINGIISSYVSKFTLPSVYMDSIVNEFLYKAESKGYFLLTDLSSEYVSVIKSANSLPMHKLTESALWKMRLPRSLDLKYEKELYYGHRVEKIKAMQILGIKKESNANHITQAADSVNACKMQDHKRLIVTD